MPGEPSTECVLAVPTPDGSTEWWKLTSGWNLIRTDPPLSSKSDVGHTHQTLGDIDLTGSVKADGEEGISGSRFIPGVGTLTFTKGILTGFTPA